MFYLRSTMLHLTIKKVVLHDSHPAPGIATILLTEDCSSQTYTVKPRFNERLFNEFLDITNDILCPGQSYSKIYGIELRYNEYNLEAQA